MASERTEATMTETFGTSERRRGVRWRMLRWGLIAAVLTTPVVAMQLTDDVNWTAADFLFVAVLLVGAELIYKLATWKVGGSAYRLMVGAALLLVVAIVWADAAAGLF